MGLDVLKSEMPALEGLSSKIQENINRMESGVHRLESIARRLAKLPDETNSKEVPVDPKAIETLEDGLGYSLSRLEGAYNRFAYLLDRFDELI